MRISDWSSDVCSSDLSAPPGTSLGSGSGVLVAPGIVVTNAHVIEGGSNFKIGRGGNNLTMIAVDPMHDLAILPGDVEGIALPMRNTAAIRSEERRVGKEWVSTCRSRRAPVH